MYRLLVVMLFLAGCPSSKKPPPAPADRDPQVVPPASDAARADAAIDAGPPRKLFVTGAGRCGECHEKMYDEWEVSGHAQAASSPLYQTMKAAAKNDPSCDGCHAPLIAAGVDELIASEGVTCDVCHTLREPVPAATGAGFRLAVHDMIKYGPRCDLDDHYFHRMGCSPEHQEAAVCGSCHWWEPKGLPVFTEYRDWRDGPAAKAGEQCQGCHMPDEKAPIANGSPTRTGVPHHGLLGLATDLRKRALGVEVEVRDDAGTIVVAVGVTNLNAGHHVPAGLPGRRIVVRARVRDAAGTELAVQSHALGRMLVDATGAEVPFWRATAVGTDTRIAQGATWQGTFEFAPSGAGTGAGTNGAGTVELEVVYVGLSEVLATQLGVTDVEQVPLVSTRIPFGAAKGGKRTKLPRRVELRPAAAGKRPRL